MKTRLMWYLFSGMLALAPFIQATTSTTPGAPQSNTMPTLTEDRLYKHTPFLNTTPVKSPGSTVNSAGIEKYLQHSHPGAMSSYKPAATSKAQTGTKTVAPVKPIGSSSGTTY